MPLSCLFGPSFAWSRFGPPLRLDIEAGFSEVLRWLSAVTVLYFWPPIFLSAVTDHLTAVTDHSTVVTDHSTVVTDHSTAVTDHSTVVTDHSTVVTDYSTAVTDP